MRSKYERKVAAELDTFGVGFDYESVALPYYVQVRGASCGDCSSKNVLKRRIYTPDFILHNGVIIEAKGRFTSGDRTKMIAVKEEHPDLDIRILFMRDNKINKKSKTYYTDWAKQHGFPCAVGSVPKNWTTKRKKKGGRAKNKNNKA